MTRKTRGNAGSEGPAESKQGSQASSSASMASSPRDPPRTGTSALPPNSASTHLQRPDASSSLRLPADPNSSTNFAPSHGHSHGGKECHGHGSSPSRASTPHVSRAGNNETPLALIPITLTIIVTVGVLALCYPTPEQWSRRINHAAPQTAWMWRVPPPVAPISEATNPSSSSSTSLFSSLFGSRDQSSASPPFIGRNEELTKLHSIVTNDAAPAFAHVFGPQGVGKSALVAEYVRRVNTDPTFYLPAATGISTPGSSSSTKTERGPPSVTIWLRGTSLQMLAADLKDLADHLGLRTHDLTLHAFADRVSAFLYKQPRWVVVVDDVVDERVLQVIPVLLPRLSSAADRVGQGLKLVSNETPTNRGAVIVVSPSLNALNPLPGATTLFVNPPSKGDALTILRHAIPDSVLMRGVDASTNLSITPETQADALIKAVGRWPYSISLAASYLTTTTTTIDQYTSAVLSQRKRLSSSAYMRAGMAAAACSRSLFASVAVAIDRAEKASPLSSTVLGFLASSSPVVSHMSTTLWAQALSNQVIRDALVPPRTETPYGTYTSNTSPSSTSTSAPPVSAQQLANIVSKLRTLSLVRGPYAIYDAVNVKQFVYHTPLIVQIAAAARYAVRSPARLPSSVTGTEDAPRVLSRLDLSAQAILSLQASRIRTLQTKVGDTFPNAYSMWELGDHEAVWLNSGYEAATHMRAAADVLAPSPLLPNTPEGTFVAEAHVSSLCDGALAGLSNLASFTALVLHRPESAIRFSDLARSRGHPLPIDYVRNGTDIDSSSTDASSNDVVEHVISPAKERFSAAQILRMSRRIAAASQYHLRARRLKTSNLLSATALALARYAVVAPDEAPNPIQGIATSTLLEAADLLAFAPDLKAPLPQTMPAPPPRITQTELLGIVGDSLTEPLPVVTPYVSKAMRRDNLAATLMVRSMVLCDCGTRLRQPPVVPLNGEKTEGIDARSLSARDVFLAISARRREVLWGLQSPRSASCTNWEAAKVHAEEALSLVWGHALTNNTKQPVSALSSAALKVLGGEDYKKAVNRIVEETSSIPTPITPVALTRYALLLERHGDYEAALTAHQFALQVELRYFSERSVPVFRRFAHIAQLWFTHMPHREREALSATYKAYTLAKGLFDDYDPRLADAYSALARAYVKTGRAAKAVKQLEDAVTIEVEAGGESHERVLARTTELGNVHYQLHQFEKALQQYHRTSRSLDMMVGPTAAIAMQFSSRCVSIYNFLKQLRAKEEAARAAQQAQQAAKTG